MTINYSFCCSATVKFNYTSSQESSLKRDEICPSNIIEGSALFNQIKKYFTKMPSPYGIDTESFVRHALITSHSLPLEIKSHLIDFKYSGNQEGYILIKSLQSDPLIPKTPKYDREILFKKSFYSEYWLSIFSSFLGDIFGYKQEGSGKLFHNIRPTETNQCTLSSESSGILLDFHTETAFHPVMPDYLLLYCLRGDRNNEASTIISSVRNFSSLLDKKTIDTLRQKNSQQE